jgi:preprotein translocase subunit SecE
LVEQRSPKPQAAGSSPVSPANNPAWTITKQTDHMKQKIVNFTNDVVKEMKKVTWPKKEELRESTGIVIVACIILAGFVYVVDRIISTVVSGLF